MATSPNYLGLSNDAVLLLAANLASVPQLSSLRALVAGYSDVLHFTAVLEILLKVLPETTSPEDYLPIVYRSYRREFEEFDASRIHLSVVDEVKQLSPQHIKRRLSAFNLNPHTPTSRHSAEEAETKLTQWFFERARRVEQETGMIDLARRLVLPTDIASFSQTPSFPPQPVIAWGKGVIQVLETFIFDNDDEDELQLLSFENLDPDSAVRLLLSRATPETVARNIKTLVAPFINYIQNKSGIQVWNTVWDWLLDKVSAEELNFVATLSSDWIPEDEIVLQQFLRTCLTASYLCTQTSSPIRQHLRRIHQNMMHLSQVLQLPEGQPIIISHPETDLLPPQLRNHSSPLIDLTTMSLAFLDQMITSADIAAHYHVTPELSLRDIVVIRDGSEQGQRHLADQILLSEQNWSKRNEEQWRKLRQSLESLRQNLVLGKLSQQTLDTMIFAAMLDATAFGLAREIFVRTHALPSDVVEKTILEAFYQFYDNATNGNRTRGGMRNAFQTLQVLDDPSTMLTTAHAVKLVSATHALSNYSLSLTPGVPITPAQIRMQKDPALLVTKVIETNHSVYREAERMLKILNDLVDGTELFKQNPNREVEIIRMQARVNASIVNAALSENDFTTAYDTCINKLSPSTTNYPNDNVISEAAWVAYYRTGIFAGRPANRTNRTGVSTSTLHDFQKMELLARAMLICPKREIEGILGHWTLLENKQLHPENAQPPTSVASEHRSLLSTAAQVGREIARTASPLLDGRANTEASRERTSSELGWGTSSSRFGVRDTVRTGLTQGIGWLLGATPQTEHDGAQQYGH